MIKPVENTPAMSATPLKILPLLPIVLSFALLGLLLLLFLLWFNTRQHFNAIEKSLSQQLDNQRATNQQSLSLAKQAADNSLQANARLIMLEQKLADSKNQQEALQNLYDQLAGNQEKTVITEVEQLLTLANQQLQLANNVKSALTAMQSADARLQNVESTKAIQLRTVIAQDMQRLQNTPNVDVAGQSIKLNQLASSIDFLPLLSEASRENVANKPVLKSPTQPSHNPALKLAGEFWQDLKNLIKISRIDQSNVVLLSPNQVFYIRENIKIRLLTARIALLQRDQATYNADLQLVNYAIRQHFLTSDQRTQTALASLRSLTASNIVIENPDITRCLNLAEKYKLSLESGSKERPLNKGVHR